MPGAETASASAAPVAAAPFKPIRSVVDAVVARATPVVNKVTPYVAPVYNKVTPYVPAQVLSAAITATNAATTKVLSYAPAANAAVDAVDARVASAVEYIHSKESALPALPAVAIPVVWVNAVNSAVKPLLSKTELLTEARSKIVEFYSLSVQTLLELKERNATAVKREEFVRELRTKLAHQWDERLQKPAEQLFEKSKTIVLTQVDAVSKNEYINSLRAQLGAAWEANVLTVYHARVEVPAAALYQTAVAYYVALYHKGGEQAASLANYLNGLRETLAHNYPQYTEKVEPLLVKLYETIKSVVAKLPLALNKKPTEQQANAASAASAALANGQN